MTYVLQLDDAARAHLRRALEAHRSWCRAQALRMPPELDELALALDRPGDDRGGHTGSEVDQCGDGRDADPVAVTLQTAARRCAVSLRTLHRWVAAGRLPVVRIGGTTRVLAADLDELMESHRAR